MNILSFVFLYVFVTTIALVRGENWWQTISGIFDNYFQRYGKTWDASILIVNSSFPPIPEPNYRDLKLWIHTKSSSTGEPLSFDSIDAENLKLFTSQFNNEKTVLYVCGYLDSNIKLSFKGKFELTSSSLIFWAYYYRNFWDAEYKRNKTASQADVSLFTNMIVVDWHAYNLDYIGSLINLPQIANLIGDKLYSMTQNSSNPLNLNNLHIIGHSLGAHLAGMIARRLNTRAGRVVVPRVTGLDPAGPVLDFPIFRELYPHLDKDCGND